MKDNLSEDEVAKKITNDMDNHFGVFIVKWNDCLNHWMVDYNIICILKYYIRYSSWADVLTNQSNLCYKNYNSNFKLPDWNIDQERYLTFYSNLEFHVQDQVTRNTMRTQHYIQNWN